MQMNINNNFNNDDHSVCKKKKNWSIICFFKEENTYSIFIYNFKIMVDVDNNNNNNNEDDD
jgi:hypothetical protein